MKSSLVVIVDGYNTHRYLLAALSAKGRPCWHVRSKEALEADIQALRRDDYLGCSDWHDDFDALCHAIPGNFSVSAVIVGAHSGVTLGDYLAEKFGVAGNPTVSSVCRQDSAARVATLERAGLATTDKMLIEDVSAGAHYLIDTLSFHGQLYIIDAWLEQKRQIDDYWLPDSKKLLSPQDMVIQQQLLPYLR